MGKRARDGARLSSKAALSELVKRPDKKKAGGCCLEYIHTRVLCMKAVAYPFVFTSTFVSEKSVSVIM